MEEELKAVEALGFATTKQIAERIDKNIRNVIKQLNSLEKIDELKIMVFSSGKVRQRVYLTNEIYNLISKT